MNTDAASANPCYYLKEGEVIPKEHRILVHDSDPVDSFSALWSQEKAGDSTQNFGFSYDVTSVEKAGLKLKTKTIKGKTSKSQSVEGPLYQIYRGETLFNLVKTVGVDGEVVDTWSNTVMGEDGTPDDSQNLCCNAEKTFDPNSGAEYDSSEYLLYSGGTSKCSQDDEIFQVKIKPFPTYNLVEVENPLSPLNVWAVLGGVLAGIDLAAGLFVQNVLNRGGGSEQGPTPTIAGGEIQMVQDNQQGGGLLSVRKPEAPV